LGRITRHEISAWARRLRPVSGNKVDVAGSSTTGVWGSPESSTELSEVNKSPRERKAVQPDTARRGGGVARIGKSITIRGNLSGEEDLVLEGRVEGRVDLPGHHLTIGPDVHHVQAELAAKALTIHGRVVGNVTATDGVEIGESGCLYGDVVTPRLSVKEGAQLNGTVTMKVPSAVAPVKGASEAEAPQTSNPTP
jgi:cytoskeletal protein CcmA (bactofilin family)